MMEASIRWCDDLHIFIIQRKSLNCPELTSPRTRIRKISCCVFIFAQSITSTPIILPPSEFLVESHMVVSEINWGFALCSQAPSHTFIAKGGINTVCM
jgi:hypothetical protein